MARSTTTCTCSPEIPWYCDTCLALRAHHDQVIAEAALQLKSLRADRAALDACAATGHQASICYCVGQPRLTAAQMYREALRLAYAELAASLAVCAA